MRSQAPEGQTHSCVSMTLSAPRGEAAEGAPVALHRGTSPAPGSLREGEHGMQAVLFAQISQQILIA